MTGMPLRGRTLQRSAAHVQAAGVAGFFGAKDVPGDNRIGAVVHDEELFATELVTCVGQVCRRC